MDRSVLTKGFWIPSSSQETFPGLFLVDFVEQIFDLPAGNAQTQVIAGHFLDRVGFIQDGHLVIRQETKALSSQSQVAEKQGIIHDQNIRAMDLPPCLEVKTLVIFRTFPAQAIIGVALHQVPDARLRSKTQIAETAVLGPPRPRSEE